MKRCLIELSLKELKEFLTNGGLKPDIEIIYLSGMQGYTPDYVRLSFIGNGLPERYIWNPNLVILHADISDIFQR